MKGKIAKIGGRVRHSNQVEEVEKVSIEYIEVTMINPQTAAKGDFLFRTNFGVVEATSEAASSLLGLDMEGLKGHFDEAKEDGYTVTQKVLFGIEYLRISHPVAAARLKHFAETD